MRATLIVLLMTGFSAAASGETIYLRDGSRINGTVVSMTLDDIEVSTQNGTLRINKSRILGIDYRLTLERSPGIERGETLLKAGLGGAVPLSAHGFNQIAGSGVASEVEGVLQIDPHWGIGLRADGESFSTTYPQTSTLSEKANVEVSALLLEGRYVVSPKDRVSPFLIGGLGLNFYTEELEGTPRSGGGPTQDLIEGNSTGLVASLGGGVQFLISRRYIAELAARWNYFQVDHSLFGFDSAQTVTMLATIGWRF